MSEMRDVSTIPLEWDVADRMRKSLRVSGVGVQDMADYLGMSRNTGDIYATQHLLGHASPVTTQGYVMESPMRLRQAAATAWVA